MKCVVKVHRFLVKRSSKLHCHSRPQPRLKLASKTNENFGTNFFFASINKLSLVFLSSTIYLVTRLFRLSCSRCTCCFFSNTFTNWTRWNSEIKTIDQTNIIERIFPLFKYFIFPSYVTCESSNWGGKKTASRKSNKKYFQVSFFANELLSAKSFYIPVMFASRKLCVRFVWKMPVK